MIETDLCCPGSFAVAAFALLAELSFVDVVVNVAATAITRQAFGNAVLVTRRAIEVAVTSRQCKASLHRVIKNDAIPTFRAVTTSAIRPVSTFMHIVVHVA